MSDDRGDGGGDAGPGGPPAGRTGDTPSGSAGTGSPGPSADVGPSAGERPGGGSDPAPESASLDQAHERPGGAPDPSGSGRVLALDVGERRLGVAVSDPTRILASPLVTVARGTVDEDGVALARIAAEQGARTLVVGLPIALDGRQRLAARKVRAYLDELGTRLPGVTVEFVDERMTTVIAERSLRAQNVRGPARRQVVDQLAATVFLQDWLDRRRSTR